MNKSIFQKWYDSNVNKEGAMLGDMEVHVTIPVKDLGAAREFYEQKLGLNVATEFPGGVIYTSGNTKIDVYETPNGGTNQGTAMSWKVDDPAATVNELKDKGVAFERYPDMPGVTMDGDLHVMEGEKAAWFKDPSGNILCINSKH